MAEEKDPGTASNSTKRLVLKFREREPVATSQGTFYARHITVGDLEAFNGYFDKDEKKAGTDLKALGELSLKSLVCTDSGPENTPALTEEIYALLTEDDIKALAAGVARACDLGPLPGGSALEALGSILFDYMAEHAKRLAESAAKIKRKLDESFGSLSATVKAALGDNLTGLSAIRESLKMSPAVEAIRKAQEEQKQLYAGLSAIGESLKMSPTMEAIRKVQEDHDRLYGGVSKNVPSPLEGDSVLGGTQTPQLHIRPIHIPKYEETPAGRAAARAAIAGEESARQLREVAGLVGQMAEHMGKLQTVFLTDVLPQWFKNLEDGSDATNTTLSQAERSLSWAKWAIIASVGVTILMTGWQLWIAHEYKIENDAQQNTSELLMRQQLAATQELNKQLAADSKRLKEEVVKLNQSVESLQTPKASEPIKPKVEKTSH